MSQTVIAARQAMIDDREKLNVAIAALDAVIGTSVEQAPPARASARVAKEAPRKPKRIATKRAALATAGAAAPSSEAVQARDAAVRARLKKGPAKFADVLEAMPVEAGLNEEQRKRALSNSLTRLRLKKVIHQGDEGWALA